MQHIIRKLWLALLMLPLAVVAEGQQVICEKVRAKLGKEKVNVWTDLTIPVESQELNRYCTKFLFGKENASLSDAYKEYLGQFDEAKTVEILDASDSYERLTLKVEHTVGDRLLSLRIMKKSQRARGKDLVVRSPERCFIFDLQTGHILTIDDVFQAAEAQALKDLCQGRFVNMLLSHDQLDFYYVKDKKKAANSLVICEQPPTVFSDYFKEAIGYEQLMAERAEREKMRREEEKEQARRQEEYQRKSADARSRALDVAEQMPSFPGGEDELQRYLAENVKYPAVAKENGIQGGRVVCSFIVDEEGYILDVDVQMSPSIDLSFGWEAKRVIRKMPRWIPGKQGGKPVCVKYYVPVTFRLK